MDNLKLYNLKKTIEKFFEYIQMVMGLEKCAKISTIKEKHFLIPNFKLDYNYYIK